MFNRTVILPGPNAHWEVWRCRSGSNSVREGSAETHLGANVGRSVVVALPSRSCRTFAFSAPTKDPEILRKLAFAQVEKRGLTSASLVQTPFHCHVVGERDGQSLVSVDVLLPDGAAALAGTPAGALLANSRLFQIPEGKLVILQEQGRLVLCAGAGGRLLHTQIVSATGDLRGHAASEIRIAMLALQQDEIISEITGVELWGEYPAADVELLSDQLGLPVETRPRPVPHTANLRRDASSDLLPPAARQALRRRRLLALRWVALAAVILPVVWWLRGERQKLHALEAEAARIESTLNASIQTPGQSAEQERLRAEHALVTAAQARWAALRMALEPRRYPVATLDALSRCLTASDVVLTRFESKLADATVSGTARSAMDAYNYFNAVNKDPTLGVYAWSMLPPTIAANGSATFEIKGKMR